MNKGPYREAKKKYVVKKFDHDEDADGLGVTIDMEGDCLQMDAFGYDLVFVAAYSADPRVTRLFYKLRS